MKALGTNYIQASFYRFESFIWLLRYYNFSKKFLIQLCGLQVYFEVFFLETKKKHKKSTFSFIFWARHLKFSENVPFIFLKTLNVATLKI